MKILHVLRSDGFAGVERHISTLANAQASAGHDVTVIGGDLTAMEAEVRNPRVTTVPGRTLTEVIMQVHKHQRVDIVHAHMTAGELAASLIARPPIVSTRHFARPRGATPVGKLSSVFIRRRVKFQIAVSEYVSRAVDGRTTIVYPGVSVHSPPDAQRRPVVLIAQRLEPEKKTAVALRAFAAGAPTHWTLEVVGDGVELATLKSLAEDLHVSDRVTFLGFRDNIPELMRTSSILIAPCEIEGLGLTVLESMAHGLPVVASSAGAHKETVGRCPNARLFTAGDWQGAARLLTELASDTEVRENYAAELLQIQRMHFTPEAQVIGTDAVYREALR